LNFIELFSPIKEDLPLSLHNDLNSSRAMPLVPSGA
jgi:hypothetical protein